MSETNLETLWKNGSKAWSNVQNASQWVEEIRGNVDEKRETMIDTPRTDAETVGIEIDENLCEYTEAHVARQLERELNAANDSVKRLESESYNLTQKIQRLESWNTQNCADKSNLKETLLHREGWIVLLLEAGDDLCAMSNNPEQRLKWNTAKQC